MKISQGNRLEWNKYEEEKEVKRGKTQGRGRRCREKRDGVEMGANIKVQKEKIVVAQKEKTRQREMSCSLRRGDQELVANYKAHGCISSHWLFLSFH